MIPRWRYINEKRNIELFFSDAMFCIVDKFPDSPSNDISHDETDSDAGDDLGEVATAVRLHIPLDASHVLAAATVLRALLESLLNPLPVSSPYLADPAPYLFTVSLRIH